MNKSFSILALIAGFATVSVAAEKLQTCYGFGYAFAREGGVMYHSQILSWDIEYPGYEGDAIAVDYSKWILNEKDSKSILPRRDGFAKCSGESRTESQAKDEVVAELKRLKSKSKSNEQTSGFEFDGAGSSRKNIHKVYNY
jgi:hypothetical protein